MGRKPAGKKAMSAAERQRRRRKKLRKEKLKLGWKAENEKKRLAAAKTYIPMPPGVTYWEKVQVEGKTIFSPKTQPLPSMYWSELRDEDLHCVIEQAQKELARRKKTR
jgi:hypothetical protein